MSSDKTTREAQDVSTRDIFGEATAAEPVTPESYGPSGGASDAS